MTVLYVGNPLIAERIAEHVAARCDPQATDDQELKFVRDWRVVRPDGKHLLPKPIERLSELTLKALMPPSSDGLIRSVLAGYGEGFSQEHSALAEKAAKGNAFRGESTVEGGNCFVFFHDGKWKAIVGWMSVVLTMIGMGETPAPAEGYDPWALRQARNLSLIQGQPRLDFMLKQAFTAPVPDSAPFEQNARELHAKRLRAQAIIQEELGVDACAFVDNSRFHIDLSLSVNPATGIVYVDRTTPESTLSAIRELGCETVTVDGIHEEVNFMNGIFREGKFITNGTRKWDLQKQFAAQLRGIDVCFVPQMDQVLRNNGGGVRCLTWEDSEI